tara:strand:+ start:6210 stop:8807 length:2598 start_codon:yes stop_codon:yes gene_type:complete
MPLRLLSLVLLVNFSTLLSGLAWANEPASTGLRGPKSTDTALMQRQLGPLNPTDTLWRIAERIKPQDSNVSTYQIMYAIYLKNPDAFIDGNLNHLRPGATLQLPDMRDIRAIDINLARAKSDADDRAWAARNNSATQTKQSASSTAAAAASAEQLQQLTELKDQFGDSMLMIESIVRENNQLKATLSQVQVELLALQQQLGEDSSLQQQLNTLLQQQADILAKQTAQEQQAAEAALALAAEQEQSSALVNNPVVWILAASIPALLLLSGVALLLKRRGQQTEAAVVAAKSATEPPADYKSPLPPLDESNDLDESGLFDIDESLLDDAFADEGDFADSEVLDDSLPDFDDDALLDDDILLDDDSLLSRESAATAAAEDDLLSDALDAPGFTEQSAGNEFDANNILSDSDLSALLSAEDDDDAIIELDDDDLTADSDTEIDVDSVDDLLSQTDAPEPEPAAEIIELDEHEPHVQTEQDIDDTAEELAPDELLEEIEVDLPDDAETPDPTEVEIEQTELQQEAAQPDAEEPEQILVETEDTSQYATTEPAADELSDSQIATLVDDESFDRTELDAFAETLALEGKEDTEAAVIDEDEQASELLSAELDELLEQVEAVDTATGEAEDIADDTLQGDDMADSVDNAVATDGPDLETGEDGSVSAPSEAALSVENPSKMLESYPDLELTDDDFIDDEVVLDDEEVSVEITPADADADESIAKLDDSQFDNLLTELEAMAQTTASDSEELSLDVDSVFSPTAEDDVVALSDADFVEIDNLLASSEQAQEDDGRFEQLNVDVGLDEFADVIGNDNPQDVDAEDNGFAAKLDLVRAYIEIDDQDSAEHIILDILDSAAPEHVKTEARSLQKPAS